MHHEWRGRAKPTDSLTAYQVEYKRTQALLSKAIDVDPEHAEALGTLIDSVDTRTPLGRRESWTRGVNRPPTLMRWTAPARGIEVP